MATMNKEIFNEKLFWEVIHNKYLLNIIVGVFNDSQYKFKNITSLQWMVNHNQYQLLKCKIQSNEYIQINQNSITDLLKVGNIEANEIFELLLNNYKIEIDETFTDLLNTIIESKNSNALNSFIKFNQLNGGKIKVCPSSIEKSLQSKNFEITRIVYDLIQSKQQQDEDETASPLKKKFKVYYNIKKLFSLKINIINLESIQLYIKLFNYLKNNLNDFYNYNSIVPILPVENEINEIINNDDTDYNKTKQLEKLFISFTGIGKFYKHYLYKYNEPIKQLNREVFNQELYAFCIVHFCPISLRQLIDNGYTNPGIYQGYHQKKLESNKELIFSNVEKSCKFIKLFSSQNSILFEDVYKKYQIIRDFLFSIRNAELWNSMVNEIKQSENREIISILPFLPTKWNPYLSLISNNEANRYQTNLIKPIPVENKEIIDWIINDSSVYIKTLCCLNISNRFEFSSPELQLYTQTKFKLIPKSNIAISCLPFTYKHQFIEIIKNYDIEKFKEYQATIKTLNLSTKNDQLVNQTISILKQQYSNELNDKQCLLYVGGCDKVDGFLDYLFGGLFKKEETKVFDQLLKPIIVQISENQQEFSDKIESKLLLKLISIYSQQQHSNIVIKEVTRLLKLKDSFGLVKFIFGNFKIIYTDKDLSNFIAHRKSNLLIPQSMEFDKIISNLNLIINFYNLINDKQSITSTTTTIIELIINDLYKNLISNNQTTFRQVEQFINILANSGNQEFFIISDDFLFHKLHYLRIKSVKLLDFVKSRHWISSIDFIYQHGVCKESYEMRYRNFREVDLNMRMGDYFSFENISSRPFDEILQNLKDKLSPFEDGSIKDENDQDDENLNDEDYGKSSYEDSDEDEHGNSQYESKDVKMKDIVATKTVPMKSNENVESEEEDDDEYDQKAVIQEKDDYEDEDEDELNESKTINSNLLFDLEINRIDLFQQDLETVISSRDYQKLNGKKLTFKISYHLITIIPEKIYDENLLHLIISKFVNKNKKRNNGPTSKLRQNHFLDLLFEQSIINYRADIIEILLKNHFKKLERFSIGKLKDYLFKSNNYRMCLYFFKNHLHLFNNLKYFNQDVNCKENIFNISFKNGFIKICQLILEYFPTRHYKITSLLKRKLIENNLNTNILKYIK